jgi:hypothetical protein
MGCTVGQRRSNDRGKEIRRFRLALWPEQWKVFDEKANASYFTPAVGRQIEEVLAAYLRRAIAMAREVKAPCGDLGLREEPLGGIPE